MIAIIFLSTSLLSQEIAVQPPPAPNSMSPEAVKERELKIEIFEKDMNWKGLENLANSWITEYPNDPSAWWCLGYSLLQQNKNEESSKASKKATELLPTMWRAWFNLGITEKRLGHIVNCMECYYQLQKIDVGIARQFSRNVLGR